MKIFVTGGTGFIGSHFLNQAHAAGYSILALRRSPDSQARIPLTNEPAWLDKPQDQVLPEDFAGCNTLVHLAAHSANVPYDTLEACIEQNVLAPIKLFRSAISAGIRRFIIAGSCFEYGRSGERYEFIPTDAPLEPTASYPASKAAATVAFHALACEQQLEMLTLRIFQVYGEGEAEQRFWPSLRRAALAGEDFPMSEGEQIRDFINVTDVAKGFLQALERSDLKAGQPLIENLGSGTPLTLGAFAEEQWSAFAATGKLQLGAVPMRRNEVMRFVPEML
jgi:nucleoside-diphosphate-sugar epimerase